MTTLFKETEAVQILQNELSRLCTVHSLPLPHGDQLLNQLATHYQLLLKWNQKIALTALTNPLAAACQHYFEALCALPYLDNNLVTGADIGSGAGFPGLPIALAKPSLTISLIEADKRKAGFLGEVRRQLQLTNLKVVCERFENVPLDYDLIMVRAIEKLETQFSRLLSASHKAQTLIFFVSKELAQRLCADHQELTTLYQYQIIELPESQNRAMLILKRIT